MKSLCNMILKLNSLFLCTVLSLFPPITVPLSAYAQLLPLHIQAGFRAQEFICAVTAVAHTLCLQPHYIPKSTGGFQLSFSQSFLPRAARCWFISGPSLPRGYGTDLETEYGALSSFMISCGVFKTANRGLCKALELCKASDFREGFGLSCRESQCEPKGGMWEGP